MKWNNRSVKYLIMILLISCSTIPGKQCQEFSNIKNKTFYWSLSGKEITIPDTQFFIQKRDNSFEVITAHFEFESDFTYRFTPSEGDMSGPMSFQVKSDSPVTLIAEIPLREEPVKVIPPKFDCR